MLANEEIKKFLNDQLNLIVDIDISVSNLRRLDENNYDGENIVKKHGFFQHHNYQLTFISVIQLSKLFGDNQKNDQRSFYSLCNLIRKVEVDYEDLCKDYDINPTRMVASKDELNLVINRNRKRLKEHNYLIKLVVNARNEVYAHTDPRPKAKYICGQNLDELLQLSKEIHNDFNLSIFNTEIRYDARDWDIDYPLEVLSKSALERLRIIEKNYCRFISKF